MTAPLHFKFCINKRDTSYNTVKELSGKQGVLVHEKCLKVLEAEIEHVRKNVALIAEGREVDERAVDETNTPRKRRSSQGDQPPSKSMA